MSWLRTVLSRAWRFLLLLFMLGFGLVVMVDLGTPGLRAQIAVGLATTWLMAVELRAATASEGQRPRILPRPAILMATVAGWAMALALVSSSVHQASQGGLANLAKAWLAATWPALPFSVLTVLWARLLRSGLWGVASPTAIPMTTAAWSLPLLILTCCGLPTPSEVATVSQALAEEFSPDRTDPARIELLLELAPTVEIGQLQPRLHAAGATATALLSPRKDVQPLPAQLAATYVLSVPLHRAAGLFLGLRLNSARVLSVQLNGRLSMGPMPPTRWCSPGADALSPTSEGVHPQRHSVADVTVAVIDTGINGLHEDLRSVMVPAAKDRNTNGHGTAVASTIVIASGQATRVRLRDYPALGGPRAATDDIARAIAQATLDGVDLINLSLAVRGAPPAAVQRAVENALIQGIIVVAAAGNGGSLTPDDVWPANIDGVIAVGATDNSGHRAPFSNRTGTHGLDLSAPGQGICAASADGGHQLDDGTSYAAATVSGLIAALQSACLGLTTDLAVDLLRRTGDPTPAGEDIGPAVRSDAAWAALPEVCPN